MQPFQKTVTGGLLMNTMHSIGYYHPRLLKFGKVFGRLPKRVYARYIDHILGT